MGRLIILSPRIVSNITNALVGTFNSTGTGTVSGGFPLKRGQLTDQHVTDRKVVVRVGGIEQEVYIEALRGRYSDGSIRSILIQFSYDTSGWVDATVELGTSVRSTSDISKTTINTTLFESGRTIIPKDVSHTKDCWVTFLPILDAAQETSVHTGLLINQFLNRYNVGKDGGITDGTYQANYDVATPLIRRWQAHGSANSTYRDMLWNGMQRGWYTLVNNTLAANGSNEWSPEPNTNSLTASGNGEAGLAEPNSQVMLSWASMYLLTGAIEFWNSLCCRAAIANWNNGSESATAILLDSHAISDTYLPRFNCRALMALILGPIIDNTKPFSATVGGFTGRTMDYPTELPWYWNAWNTNRFAKGDYRDNFRGADDNTTDGQANGASGIGDFPNFQAAIASHAMLIYYLNVKADDTIAGYIKQNVDIVWDNKVVELESGDAQFDAGATHGYDYWCNASVGSQAMEGPLTFHMWADLIAFCKAKYGDAKYTTNLAIAMAEANMEGDLSGGSLGGIGNLTWGNLSSNWWTFWKLMGELVTFACAAPYFDVVGLPPDLPSSIRTPTQY